MDVLNRKSLLLGIALCMSSAALAQAPNTGAPGGPPKAAPYDCFGLAGVALRSCVDLNAAAADAGNNTPSASHDCGGMTGTALATCRELKWRKPRSADQFVQSGWLRQLRDTRLRNARLRGAGYGPRQHPTGNQC